MGEASQRESSATLAEPGAGDEKQQPFTGLESQEKSDPPDVETAEKQKQQQEDKPEPPPDGGYGWVCVTCVRLLSSPWPPISPPPFPPGPFSIKFP